MKKYLFAILLLLLPVLSYAQRYGRMSDVIEATSEEAPEGYVVDDGLDPFTILFLSAMAIGAIVLICKYIYDKTKQLYLFLKRNTKRFIFSKWVYIPLYPIWITFQVLCLVIGKDRKPYRLFHPDTQTFTLQTQEECFYPFRHFHGANGQCEPLYAYDSFEFILYGFAIPLVFLGLYLIVGRKIKGIWFDGIYIFLTIWFFMAFILAVTFYSDGSVCGFWIGWLPALFLTATFLDSKEAYLKQSNTNNLI